MIVSKYTEDGIPIDTLKPRSEKRILVECEYCKKQRYVTRGNLTTTERNRKDGTTPCTRCNKIHETGPKNKGRPGWGKGLKRPLISGKDHPMWKGGAWVSYDGYQMVRATDKRGWAAYQKEHRIKMEEALQRSLLPGEVIHHINGDKLDNNISNLHLFSSDKEHRCAHNSLERIAFKLVKSGQITFDTKSNSYVLNEEWL